jgi:hypothetical protein
MTEDVYFAYKSRMATPNDFRNLARALRAEAVKPGSLPLGQAKLGSLADQLNDIAELCRLEKALANPLVERSALHGTADLWPNSSEPHRS